jgi:predicted metalloprotease
MRWQGRRSSGNIEDRRGMRMGAPMMSGTGLIILIVLSLLFGVNPLALLEQVGPVTQVEEPSGAPGAEPTDELGQFVSVVLADTEETWHDAFQSIGRSYEEPTLVLFSQVVRSACGMAQSAMGPFYCPLDGKVYIDLSFYRDLRDRFGAPGDFAQAYVIAHEVGHHVQNLLGISGQVQQAQQRSDQAEANALSVRLELQADCFAGVWAHHAERARDLLEQGDVEEGLNAASAIGDDRLQRQSQGTVVPESFTHGSAEQRVRWFERGIQGGTIDVCNTFDAPAL